LDNLINGTEIYTNRTSKDHRNKTIRVCEGLKLIRYNSKGEYILDENGILAIQDGGIENYLEKLGTEKDLDFIIKGLTKKSLKNQFWYNIVYVLIGGAIGLITTMATQYNKEAEIKQVQAQASAINDKHDSCQIGLQQMRLEITSLKNEIDFLKFS
jgi:hypothetical protein